MTSAAARQPVHTMYGGAHRFSAGTFRKMGTLALESLRENGPFPGISEAVRSRMAEKLEREPVEDFRIDFEDGYGHRTGEEEDGHAVEAARQLTEARLRQLPPFIGIRIKALTETSRDRALRTLELFLNTLFDGAAMRVSPIVTLPKITRPDQVAELAEWLRRFEQRKDLATGYFPIELMVETPESIRILPSLVEAAQGRCSAAHFGAYDYTASLDIAVQHQRLDHPACDFARNMMLISLAGTGVRLSDGAFNILPMGDPAAVREAWKLHFAQIQRSLSMGFYQGWDLHPAQLPARYAAVYAFYLDALPAASARLANFLAASAKATRLGTVFDDAATGHGLLNFFLRGVECGALTADEVESAGASIEQLKTMREQSTFLLSRE